MMARRRSNTALVVAELQRIQANDPDSMLVKQAIVNAARPDDSPLHDEFNWDDGDAAERFRLIQAGALVRRLKIHLVSVKEPPRQVDVEIVAVDRKPRSVRAFQAPRGSRGGEGGGYRSVFDIADDDVLAADMADTLRGEFAALIRRAQNYLDAAQAGGRAEPLLQQYVQAVAQLYNELWPSPFSRGDGQGDGADEGAVA